jgi:hypothetical protein
MSTRSPICASVLPRWLPDAGTLSHPASMSGRSFRKETNATSVLWNCTERCWAARFAAGVSLAAMLLLVSCGGNMAGPAPISPPPPPSGTTPAGGPFTAAGSMNVARGGHTATLLSNGQVLIAGGLNPGFPAQLLASAEIYDPSSGTFFPASNMTKPRARATATLLANGKVLIAGGFKDPSSGTYDTSAEIYDPSTGTFTATGNMVSSGSAASTLLHDGRVFIAVAGVNAEIYDPSTGTFALTGAYAGSSPGYVDTATLLADGRVLVTGCAQKCTIGVTELYDPSTNSFSLTDPLSPWDNENTATLLTNGAVLFVGSGELEQPANAELYDPVAGKFTTLENSIASHEFAAAARLLDGTVLITGGQLAGGDGSPAAELYLPATGGFELVGDMTAGRHEHTATLLRDGTVLIAGGYSGWPNPTATAEIYKPSH